MKIWLLIGVLLFLVAGMVFGGIYVYQHYVDKTPVVNAGPEANIGIFDIKQNCTMTELNEIKDCCKGICVKYCTDLGRTYVNHFLNQNNEIMSCYCWC